jgi:coenzyme F420 hydrogenase subunit beta
MQWNDRGEYNPIEIESAGDCLPNCSLCYKVCPAHGKTRNETELARQLYGETVGIKHRKETGYYLSTYVGYSEEHRAEGASGGMATWVLENLFVTNEVDSVVAVGKVNSPDRLFQFKICHSVEDIRACSRSVYYPVEVSHVVQHILKNKGSYAIISLPCVCKAIRLAQEKFPHLRSRIKYVLGLTCNHQCSYFFSEYICAHSGGNPHQLKGIVFREKDAEQPASNHKITILSDESGDKKISEIFWRDGGSKAYTSGYFQIPGCFYCDDVFAECADACFMDAWLRSYAKDPKGNNLLIVRNEVIDILLHKCKSIQPIDISSVIASQKSVIEQKQYRRRSDDEDVPVLRKEVERAVLLQVRIMKIKKALAEFAPHYWNVYGKSTTKFERAIYPLFKQLKKLIYWQRFLRLPVRIWRRLRWYFDDLFLRR